MKEIRGRPSIRNRRVSYKDLEQPDGSLNPQQYETLYNNSLKKYTTSTLKDNEMDEGDFCFQHNKAQQSVPAIKKQHLCTTISKTSRQESQTTLTSWNIGIITITISIMALYILHWSFPAANECTVTNHVLQFSKDLKVLGKKFNLPKDSLRKIKVGVNMIHDDESAGSFTLLYNSGANNFHKRQFNEMLKDIANATAKYLRNGNGSYIEIESNNLKEANHEELMNSYDSTLLESGVMLVKDLDSLPSNLAMAFHYICDEYDPLVKKTAIFFTIDKQKCSVQSNSEPHKWIEKCLAEKWRNMREDSISPLLARVVEIIVEI